MFWSEPRAVWLVAAVLGLSPRKRTPELGLGPGFKPVAGRAGGGRAASAQQLICGWQQVEVRGVLSERGLFPGEGIPKIIGTAKAGVGARMLHHQRVVTKGL